MTKMALNEDKACSHVQNINKDAQTCIPDDFPWEQSTDA